jgi:addiction module RelE/StbE family toxin
MERKIVWTETASKDVEAIVRYICRRNPAAAHQIGNGIFTRVEILIEHPSSGSVIPELQAGGWRKLLFRRWLIIYTIRDDAIVIGRVWPAAKGEPELPPEKGL